MGALVIFLSHVEKQSTFPKIIFFACNVNQKKNPFYIKLRYPEAASGENSHYFFGYTVNAPYTPAGACREGSRLHIYVYRGHGRFMDARELKMKSIPSNPEIARTYTRLWMWGSWTTPRAITEPAVCEGVNVLPLLKKKSDRERERERDWSSAIAAAAQPPDTLIIKYNRHYAGNSAALLKTTTGFLVRNKGMTTAEKENIFFECERVTLCDNNGNCSTNGRLRNI